MRRCTKQTKNVCVMAPNYNLLEHFCCTNKSKLWLPAADTSGAMPLNKAMGDGVHQSINRVCTSTTANDVYDDAREQIKYIYGSNSQLSGQRNPSICSVPCVNSNWQASLDAAVLVMLRGHLH